MSTLFFCFLFFFFASCESQNRRKTFQQESHRQHQTFSFIGELNNIPIDPLPYSANDLSDIVQKEAKNRIRSEFLTINTVLNAYFRSDSGSQTKYNGTILNGYQSTNEGYFFRRLPPLNQYEILIYLSQNLNDEYAIPSASLLVLNRQGIIIDRLKIYGGTRNEGKIAQSSKIDKDYIIHSTIYQIDYYNYDDQGNISGAKARPDSMQIAEYYFKVKGNGKIVRYFKKERAKINTEKEKGEVTNHFKNGLWREYEIDTSDTDLNNFVRAVGYYSDGEKDSEWLYFSSDDEDYEYPRLAQKYKSGTLIEQTDDFEKIERHYPLLKLLQVK